MRRNVEADLRRLGPTANLFDLADMSASELKRILRRGGMNCDEEIDQVLRGFKDGLGENGNQLLGRSLNRPGSAAENILCENWGFLA